MTAAIDSVEQAVVDVIRSLADYLENGDRAVMVDARKRIAFLTLRGEDLSTPLWECWRMAVRRNAGGDEDDSE